MCFAKVISTNNQLNTLFTESVWSSGCICIQSLLVCVCVCVCVCVVHCAD
jgi:hypothetical protein